MLMKKLDKLILKSFIGPFILTFAVVVFILLTQTMIKYFDEFVGKGLDFSVFAELLFYFSLNTTPVALPLAVLLSSLITFGNLGEHSELTAVKSSGISLVRVLVPIFIFTIGITFVAFWFNNTIVPKANLNAYSLLWDIRQKKPSLDIKEGVFYNGLTGYSIKASRKVKQTDGEVLLDVMIYDHTGSNGNTRVILADTCRMYTINNERYLVFELFNGSSYAEYVPDARRSRRDEFQRDKFEHSKMIFNLASFDLSRTKKELFAGNRLMKNVAELRQATDSMHTEYGRIQKNALVSSEQYYYYRYKKPVDTLQTLQGAWIDSLQVKEYTLAERQDILGRAANQARNVKSFVQSTAQQGAVTLKEARVYEVEKYNKYAQSVACLVMFLIGAPLGSIIKKGGLGMPVLVSIIFFIIFYVMSLLGQKWAKEGLVIVPYGVWAADFILFWIGMFFLRQARSDSRLFDVDAYKVSFGRFMNKWKKKRTKIKDVPMVEVPMHN
jgi:lipopolysaccharide export system permease protein